MAGSPDPKAGRIVDRHLTLCAPRGEGYQGQSPWLVSMAPSTVRMLRKQPGAALPIACQSTKMSESLHTSPTIYVAAASDPPDRSRSAGHSAIIITRPG